MLAVRGSCRRSPGRPRSLHATAPPPTRWRRRYRHRSRSGGRCTCWTPQNPKCMASTTTNAKGPNARMPPSRTCAIEWTQLRTKRPYARAQPAVSRMRKLAATADSPPRAAARSPLLTRSRAARPGTRLQVAGPHQRTRPSRRKAWRCLYRAGVEGVGVSASRGGGTCLRFSEPEHSKQHLGKCRREIREIRECRGGNAQCRRESEVSRRDG